MNRVGPSGGGAGERSVPLDDRTPPTHIKPSSVSSDPTVDAAVYLRLEESIQVAVQREEKAILSKVTAAAKAPYRDDHRKGSNGAFSRLGDCPEPLRPMIDLRLLGDCGVPRTELDLDGLRQMCGRLLNALHVNVHLMSSPEGHSVLQRELEGHPLREIESKVLRERILMDSRYRSSADIIVDGLLDVKELVVSGAEPSILLERLSSFYRSARGGTANGPSPPAAPPDGEGDETNGNAGETDGDGKETDENGGETHGNVEEMDGGGRGSDGDREERDGDGRETDGGPGVEKEPKDGPGGCPGVSDAESDAKAYAGLRTRRTDRRARVGGRRSSLDDYR